MMKKQRRVARQSYVEKLGEEGAGPPAARSRRSRSSARWLAAAAGLIVVAIVVLAAVRLLSNPDAGRPPVTAQTPLPVPTVQVDSREHRWLARPLDRTAPRDFADRTYLFGTSKNNAYRVHHGLDIVNPTGTPVYAAADGTVVFAGRDAGTRFGPSTIPNFYGNMVLVRLPQQQRGQDVYYLNGHLDSVSVREGQQVRTGDVLGKIGMTGTADGPHLHFEVRVGGTTYAHSRNPALWLRYLPGAGGLAGLVTDQAGKAAPGVTITLLKDLTASDLQKYWGEATTYPDDPLGRLNADEQWNENFAVADLPVGLYEVRANVRGQTYLRQVSILDGRTTWLEIKEGSNLE